MPLAPDWRPSVPATLPVIPADLTALTNEELSVLVGELVALFEELAPTVVDGAGVIELTELAASIEGLRDEAGRRPEAVAALRARVEAAAAALRPAGTRTSLSSMTARQPAATRPRTVGAGATRIVTPSGEPIGGVSDIARHLKAAISHFDSSGLNERSVIARFTRDLGEPFGEDPVANQRRLETVRAALTAAGGLCGPTEGFYSQLVVAGAARPVRDALPNLPATRGGIRFNPPPKLSTITQGVGVISAAFDASGQTFADGATTNASTTVTSATAAFTQADVGRTITGAGIPAGATILAVTNSTTAVMSQAATATASGVSITIGRGSKATFTVSCPSIIEVVVQAIYTSLQMGNFLARSFPEQVEAWVELGAALHARVAEQALLDAIAANSTAVTAAGLVGAAREVLVRIGQAAMGYRSRNRMDPAAPLTVLLPAWAQSLIRADLTRGFTDDTDVIGLADAQINAWFAVRHLNVSWYLDSKTGGNQVIGAQSVGVLNQYPTTCLGYVFAPGSFVFLDSGTLDLGVVRDSALNAQNNFRVFTENFEAAAFVGIESLEVAMTLAPDGTYGAAKAVTIPIVS